MNLRLAGEVRQALATRQPIVALESTVIAHGLPAPDNLETALALEAEVRSTGAVPATIAIIAGEPVIGLDRRELELVAGAGSVEKCGIDRLALVMARKQHGATTVASTVALAARAGIAVVATGGIGGVHRGGEQSFDVSGDLAAISRYPVATVCSGAKAILDLARTIELLETLGVPLLGWKTGCFPAFYCSQSPWPVAEIASMEELVAVLQAQGRVLSWPSGVLVLNPPPAELAIPAAEFEALLAPILGAIREGPSLGRDETPRILQALAASSGGRTLACNKALLAANARLAGQLASALAQKGLKGEFA